MFEFVPKATANKLSAPAVAFVALTSVQVESVCKKYTLPLVVVVPPILTISP